MEHWIVLGNTVHEWNIGLVLVNTLREGNDYGGDTTFLEIAKVAMISVLIEMQAERSFSWGVKQKRKIVQGKWGKRPSSFYSYKELGWIVFMF